MSEHIRKSHNVSCILYHLVCPAKYRRLVFSEIEGVERVIIETCQEIAKRYEIHFVEVGTDQDHIHFLIQSIPIMSPKRAVQIVKSITAREVFNKVPLIKRFLWGGEFWTKGYYLNTVGKAGNEEFIRNYVKQQNREYKQIYRDQLKLFDGMS